MLTILLAGLCLNLSAPHLHSLNEYPAKGENSGLHYTQDELPFCFACKHISYGELSPGISIGPLIDNGSEPHILIDEGKYDHTPDLHLNKSPPESPVH